MKNYFFSFPTAFVLFLVLFVQACGFGDKKAKPLPDNVGDYLFAYTSGTISRMDDIKVQFARNVVSFDEVGTTLSSDILSFSPSIEGKAVWLNEQTLVVETEEPLKSSSTYVASLKLNRLFDEVPKSLENVEFDFRTLDLTFEVDIEGMSIKNRNDLSSPSLIGKLYFSDQVPLESAKSILRAKQNGNELKVDLNGSNRTYDFEITGIERTDKASEVIVNWHGSAMKIKNKGNQKYTIPALNDFKVISSSVAQGSNQSITVVFSDPLMEGQDLQGLVTIGGYGEQFTHKIEGNRIILYPSTRMTGRYTINVHPGLKNSMGAKMKNKSEWNVDVQSMEPGVRLVGQGVIMPNSKNLKFPFEAVGLNSVEVEIFKIYENNILQFLQYNNISGSRNLREVGKIVLQKKIDLYGLNAEGKRSEWSRYALDLNELFKNDKNAIFQIRIGFRPEYATYPCEEEQEDNLVATLNRKNERGEYNSILDGWYGINGYYPEYDWSHRKDPCYPAYYNSERFVSRNVIATNLGVTVKKAGEDNIFVAVADLRTTASIAGASIDFYDYQQQLLKSISANSEGMAFTELPEEATFVIVSKGDEKSYLNISDGNALSLSKFDVAGSVSKSGLKGYLYGDRGVWRPGDSVYLNFILEDKLEKLPENYPISYELFDPTGQLKQRKSILPAIENFYDLRFSTSPDAITGTWRMKVLAGGNTFEKALKIETVKPNRLKVDLDFGKEKLNYKDNPFQANLQVNWLHGAPGSDLNTKVEMALNPLYTSFSGFEDFHFSDPTRILNTSSKVIFEKKVDKNGFAKIKSPLLGSNMAPAKVRATFKTRAFEKGGDFSTNLSSIDFSPYKTYVGAKLPTNEWGQSRVKVDQEAEYKFVCLDDNGKAVPGKKLSVGIYHIDWNWWWDGNRSRMMRFNHANNKLAAHNAEIVTDKSGEISWNAKILSSGRYLIRVCDTESGHCSGREFYCGYPWYGESDNNVAKKDASVLTFSADKKKYTLGDVVELSVPSGDIGKILLTLENSKGIIESRWQEVKAGVNKIKIQTTQEMLPNFYAHVSLLQPHAQTENDLPIRMYGVIPVLVEDEETVLKPVIEMPDELKPEKNFDFAVEESNGKEMTYTISIVDEGLLDLTNYKTPDPWSHFYAKEANNVHTWDYYDEIIGAYAGELESVLSIGGDGEIQPGEAKNRANRFKPVVMHLGPFKLKKGEKKSHQITMPNYVGSVRAMVVAADDKGAYGSEEKTVQVKKPLMILATLPRVLGPGESLKLPVEVFAMKDFVKNVEVRLVESTGLVQLQGGSSNKLRFEKVGSEMSYFDLNVKEQLGVAKFKVEARSGKEYATQEIEIQVRNPNPYITTTELQTISDGNKIEFDLVKLGMEGTNSSILELSTIPSMNLDGRLKYLVQYPHGCLEQITSKLFPQLYLSSFIDLSEEKKEEIDKLIRIGIDKIASFQSGSSGFRYWPSGNYYNQWANSYVGHFLISAEAQGYVLPPGILKKWTRYQKDMANNWSFQRDMDYYYNSSSNLVNQAYRLYTLALSGNAQLGAMNRFREQKELNVTAKWLLAGAYAHAGKKKIAKQMIQGASKTVENYAELSYNYGSSLRDRALILDCMLAMDLKDEAAELTLELAKTLGQNRWYNTQAIGVTLSAIGKMLGTKKGGQKSYKLAYQLGDAAPINIGAQNNITRIEIPESDYNRGKISLSSDAENIIFARIIRRGQPAYGNEEAAQNKININVKYLNTNNSVLDISKLKQGTDFIAQVSVHHPGIYQDALKELALTQIFPPGWEITNQRMEGPELNNNKNSRFSFQDIRDDRVNTYFDLYNNQTSVYNVRLNAAYEGRYYLGGPNVEAMYDGSIYARTKGQWVEVVAAE